MSIDLVTRGEWGARSPKGGYIYLPSTHGVKVHYAGGRVDPGIVRDHDRCVEMVRRIQRHHMYGNGWLDIGYSALACPHRKVFVGRGPHHLPAANGAGLNSGHYAVMGLVGSSGLVDPPASMLHGIRDAIEWLRREGRAGSQIKGHRDGYATSCPGDRLYAWVRRGAPRPEEDEVSAHDVWHDPIIKMNKHTDGEREWSAAKYLQHIEGEQDTTQTLAREIADVVNAHDARLAAQDAKLDAILAKLEGVGQ